jgi:hypothetical protein
MQIAVLGAWDYVRGDARLVGAVVLVVAVAAVAYVVRRLWSRRDRRR